MLGSIIRCSLFFCTNPPVLLEKCDKLKNIYTMKIHEGADVSRGRNYRRAIIRVQFGFCAYKFRLFVKLQNPPIQCREIYLPLDLPSLDCPLAKFKINSPFSARVMPRKLSNGRAPRAYILFLRAEINTRFLIGCRAIVRSRLLFCFFNPSGFPQA